MVISTALKTRKKTYNIESKIIDEMEKLVSSRKQTAFVNKALKELLEKEKQEKAKQEYFEALHDIAKHAKVPSKPVAELIRDIRESRGSRRD